MSNVQSQNDVAVSALAWLLRAEQASERINDYGEVTGIRDEIDQLRKDAENAFRSIEKRAYIITKRSDIYRENITLEKNANENRA